jgi:hypothetical protein
MTILNIALRADEVCIVTDTLMCDADLGGAVTSFGTKVFALPHMRGLVTGVGLFPFIQEWAATLNCAITFPDMRAVDKVAPRLLRESFAKHRGTDARPLTSTVYHFGYDTRRRRCFGFGYRSAGGFTSGRVRYGNISHPWLDFDLDRHPNAAIPDDLIAYGKRQRVEFPPEEGPLGGHLMLHRMQAGEDGEPVLMARICHTFAEDAEVVERCVTRAPPGWSDR